MFPSWRIQEVSLSLPVGNSEANFGSSACPQTPSLRNLLDISELFIPHWQISLRILSKRHLRCYSTNKPIPSTPLFIPTVTVLGPNLGVTIYSQTARKKKTCWPFFQYTFRMFLPSYSLAPSGHHFLLPRLSLPTHLSVSIFQVYHSLESEQAIEEF